MLRLRWVKARVDEGMQTGQAIRALHHLQEGGHLPETPFVPAAPKPYVSVEDPSLSVFREHLSKLLMDHELQQADQLLGEVLALYSLEDLILEVITPSLSSIGEAWHEGAINVATEHLATNFLRQHLLMWMQTGPQPYQGVSPVILACAPGEWHEASLLIMGVLLRRMRWPVAYLGQNVPLDDLGTLIHSMKPPAVIFVAMTEELAQELLAWPDYIPSSDGGGRPIVGYGGRVFNDDPEWREKMPGVYLGDTLRDGLTKLDELLHQAVRVTP